MKAGRLGFAEEAVQLAVARRHLAPRNGADKIFGQFARSVGAAI